MAKQTEEDQREKRDVALTISTQGEENTNITRGNELFPPTIIKERIHLSNLNLIDRSRKADMLKRRRITEIFPTLNYQNKREEGTDALACSRATVTHECENHASFDLCFFPLPRKAKQNGDIRPWPGTNEEEEERGRKEGEGKVGGRSFILCKACVHRLDLWSAASTTARLSLFPHRRRAPIPPLLLRAFAKKPIR